jgi:hypothetical protein
MGTRTPGHRSPGSWSQGIFLFYFFIFLGVLFFHEKKDTRDLVREPGKLTNRGSPVLLSVLFHGPVLFHRYTGVFVRYFFTLNRVKVLVRRSLYARSLTGVL